jgi:RNA polymerase sigma factor (sigma-70 family)
MEGNLTFDEIVKTYSKPLLGYIYSRLDNKLRSRVSPEDVLQEVFIEAYRRYPKFLEKENLTVAHWIYRITTDQIINTHRYHFESQKRSVGREEKDKVLPNGNRYIHIDNVQINEKHLEQMANKELADIIRSDIKKLPVNDQEVLWLRLEEGLNNKESSEMLGVTNHLEGMRYLRALRRLKEITAKEKTV